MPLDSETLFSYDTTRIERRPTMNRAVAKYQATEAERKKQLHKEEVEKVYASLEDRDLRMVLAEVIVQLNSRTHTPSLHEIRFR
jgi:hypothetical protein